MKINTTSFWAKVNKTPTCWEWTSLQAGKGYGCFAINGKNHYAHRISWTLQNGPIPAAMCICHVCDNRLCVRPDHLFLGTYQDNIRDCIRKKRFRVAPHDGENNPNAKLTIEDVLRIRELRAAGVKLKVLSSVFGVSMNQIRLIQFRRNWGNV